MVDSVASVLLDETKAPADGFLRVFVPLALHDDLLATEDERLATLLREVHASVITDGREDGEEFANFRIGDHEDECGKLRGV